MQLLDALLEKNIRLVDFECIRNEAGRLVAFGRFAGIAGTFDFLRGCGEYFLQRGYQTPLIYLGSAYMYEDWDDMKHALSRVAKGISVGALKALGPVVFAVTGTGRVSTGALEVLKQLPHEFVDPLNLEALVTNDSTPCDRIYICHLRTADLVARKDGQLFEAFDKVDYYENPQNYTSVFAQRHLPYVSFLIQGVYWEPKYPRTLTIDNLRKSKLSGGRL